MTVLNIASQQAETLLRRVRLVVFDFDGVFTDNAVWVFQDGREAVRCTRADGIGLSLLRQVGIEMSIISTEANPVVSARAAKLAMPCIQSCLDKKVAIQDLAASHGIDLRDTAFVGNDLNDAPALSVVGLPIIVSDAHRSVAHLAVLQTTRPGGHGAVREVCDWIVGAREKSGSA